LNLRFKRPEISTKIRIDIVISIAIGEDRNKKPSAAFIGKVRFNGMIDKSKKVRHYAILQMKKIQVTNGQRVVASL
jgi:hypothetical protein